MAKGERVNFQSFEELFHLSCLYRILNVTKARYYFTSLDSKYTMKYFSLYVGLYDLTTINYHYFLNVH